MIDPAAHGPGGAEAVGLGVAALEDVVELQVQRCYCWIQAVVINSPAWKFSSYFLNRNKVTFLHPF